MKAINNYLQETYILSNIESVSIEKVTYESYCAILDVLMEAGYSDEKLMEYLTEGFFKDFLKSAKGRAAGFLHKTFRSLRKELKKIGKDFNVSGKELVYAFKNREAFGILKAFGFNLKVIFRSINRLSNLVQKGLFKVFSEIVKNKYIQKIRKGAMKVDDLLNKYPILKRVSGIVIAGLLLYLWLQMTFIGSWDYDMDLSDLFLAVQGKFSIADLFVSPSGLMLLALFGSGAAFGLSIPWLGKSLYNLISALVYTVYTKFKKGKHPVLKKMKQKLKKVRLK